MGSAERKIFAMLHVGQKVKTGVKTNECAE